MKFSTHQTFNVVKKEIGEKVIVCLWCVYQTFNDKSAKFLQGY